MNDTTQTLLRALLKIGAGYAISKGIADESTWTVISAGVVGLIAVIWGVLNRPNAPTTVPVVVPVKVSVLSLALSLGLFTTLFVGCASGPERAAYNVVSAPVTTSEQAMTIWGDYVKQHPQTAATEMKVLAAYRKVKAAELAAIDVAHAAANMMSSTNSLTSTITTELASPEAAQALTDLVALIRSLGAKI